MNSEKLCKYKTILIHKVRLLVAYRELAVLNLSPVLQITSSERPYYIFLQLYYYCSN